MKIQYKSHYIVMCNTFPTFRVLGLYTQRSIKNVYKVILSHRIRIARAFLYKQKKNCICSLRSDIFYYMGVGLCIVYTQRQLLTNARNKCSSKKRKKKESNI